MSISNAAYAADWYVGGFAGAAFETNYAPDLVFTARGTVTATTDIDADTGYILGGVVGAKGLLLPNVRTELEVSHSRSGMDDFDFIINGTPVVFQNSTSSGRMAMTNILLNAW